MVKQTKRKTTRNSRKRRKIRGGFAPTILNVSSTVDLQPVLDQIETSDLIYISIGSKYNEPGNAAYQMVPFFLYNNSCPRADSDKKKILCIAIDVFENDSSLANLRETARKGFIPQYLENDNPPYEPYDYSNINLYIVNIAPAYYAIMREHAYNPEPHADFLGLLLDFIGARLRQVNYDSKSLMVCNYVKFKHPNPMEFKLGTQISSSIVKALMPHGYKDSVYNWCGYTNPSYYNCIMQGTKKLLPIRVDPDNICVYADESDVYKSLYPIKNIWDKPGVNFSSNHLVYSIAEYTKKI